MVGVNVKFMLLVRSNPSAFDLRDAAAEEMQPAFEAMARLNQELMDSGELVDAAGLAGPAEAKTVRNQGGTAVVTDGPFAEAKEVLGGYWVLDCESLDRALEIAQRAVSGPGPDNIEVRAIAG